jgi:hypothetical protein
MANEDLIGLKVAVFVAADARTARLLLASAPPGTRRTQAWSRADRR